MSVTAFEMFLWFCSVVASSNVKSVRQIKSKQIFLEKWPLQKGTFLGLVIFSNLD